MGIFRKGLNIAVSLAELTLDKLLAQSNTANEKQIIIRSQFGQYSNTTTLDDGGVSNASDDGEGNGQMAFLQNGGLGLSESNSDEHSSAYYGSHHVNFGYERPTDGISNHFSFEWAANPSVQMSEPVKKALLDALGMKPLYCHNMMLRFNDGNRKLKVSLITNGAEAYTVADLTAYLKAHYSATAANITGNLTAIIPGCMGYYKDAGGNWYDMLGLVYCTDYNAVCPVGRLQSSAASNQLTVLNSHSGTYTVTDNVIPIND